MAAAHKSVVKGADVDPFADLRKAPNARPETVANALGISGKLVRGFLRQTFTRPIEAKGTTWVLSNDQTNATIDHFLARRSPTTIAEAVAADLGETK